MAVPIRAVEPCKRGAYFYIRKPLEEYPWLVREILRFLYKRYGYNFQDGSVESMAFYLVDEDEAKEIAEREGWAFQMLPINSPLPLETCQYGMNDVPWSKARKRMGVDRDLPFEAVEKKPIENRIAKLRESVRDLNAVLK